jgi:hypothetical protein
MHAVQHATFSLRCLLLWKVKHVSDLQQSIVDMYEQLQR